MSDLSFDWSILYQQQDEVVKTLLERNAELETMLTEYKVTTKEKDQEILHHKRMREINDSRLKVIDQLEADKQDLERTNENLLIEVGASKKHIRKIMQNLETTESRCEDLNKQIEQLQQELQMEQRKNERLIQEQGNALHADDAVSWARRRKSSSKLAGHSSSCILLSTDFTGATPPENCSFAFKQRNKANSTGIADDDAIVVDASGGPLRSSSLDLSIICNDTHAASKNNGDLHSALEDELKSLERQLRMERQRNNELEKQLSEIIQENQRLRLQHEQHSSINEQTSTASLLNELSLEMQPVPGTGSLNNSKFLSDLNASSRSSSVCDLREKYEALIDATAARCKSIQKLNVPSLAEELQTSGFFKPTKQIHMSADLHDSNLSIKAAPNRSCCSNASVNFDSLSNNWRECKPVVQQEYTTCSEADTSSLGFSDEIVNKSTQTDQPPADGESLYTINNSQNYKLSFCFDAASGKRTDQPNVAPYSNIEFITVSAKISRPAQQEKQLKNRIVELNGIEYLL